MATRTPALRKARNLRTSADSGSMSRLSVISRSSPQPPPVQPATMSNTCSVKPGRRNCCPMQLRRPGFTEQVLDIVAGWTGGGWGLDLEITESLLIDPESAEVLKLRALRNAGVRVAIDDFGTGYSSLSRLSDLPVDTLKIDRSFINGLPGDRASARLVPTVISLARAFDLVTVAEGVETRAQFNFLERAGCVQSQGFLHAQPMPAAALESMLASRQQPQDHAVADDTVNARR